MTKSIEPGELIQRPPIPQPGAPPIVVVAPEVAVPAPVVVTPTPVVLTPTKSPAPKYCVTNKNLVILHGGNKDPKYGIRSHNPIFKDASGTEHIRQAGKFVKVQNLNLKVVGRETAEGR